MVSLSDCEGVLTGDDAVLCREIVTLNDKFEDIQTQIYIISGAVGGVLLVLLILIIVLFVKLNNAFKRTGGLNYRGDELAKRGFATYTGAPIPQPLSSPPVKSYGYDNNTFDQPRSQNAMNSAAGGVRVLPRNPPALRNNNQGGQMDEGYY